MTSEEYGQYIDDFELGADVMPGESLTDYIERRRREFDSKADGGAIGIEVLFTEKKPRKNFFMGGPALEGQALSIYNSMNAYGFTDQQIADALSARGLSSSGIKTNPKQVTGIINQQLQTGGGRDNLVGGIGRFGNLDPNTKKTMQVEVADGKGGVTIKEVDTYLDQGGMRKTLDNKNPVNLGLDVKPMAVSIFESMFGKKTDTDVLPEGKILGALNNPNYANLSFFGKLKADAVRRKELKQLQDELELQEKLKQQIKEQEQKRFLKHNKRFNKQ